MAFLREILMSVFTVKVQGSVFFYYSLIVHVHFNEIIMILLGQKQ